MPAKRRLLGKPSGALAAVCFRRGIRQGYRPMKKMKQLPPADVYHLMFGFRPTRSQNGQSSFSKSMDRCQSACFTGREDLEDPNRACGNFESMASAGTAIFSGAWPPGLWRDCSDSELNAGSNLAPVNPKKPTTEVAAIDPESLNGPNAQALNLLLKLPDTVLGRSLCPGSLNLVLRIQRESLVKSEEPQKARTNAEGRVRQDRPLPPGPGLHGPTEALNNLIKRIKRIGFGFRILKNYRIRALL